MEEQYEINNVFELAKHDQLQYLQGCPDLKGTKKWNTSHFDIRIGQKLLGSLYFELHNPRF